MSSIKYKGVSFKSARKNVGAMTDCTKPQPQETNDHVEGMGQNAKDPWAWPFDRAGKDFAALS